MAEAMASLRRGLGSVHSGCRVVCPLAAPASTFNICGERATHTHTHNKHRHISAQDCRNVAQAQQAAQNTQHTRNVHHQGDVGGAARRGRHAETRRLGHQACRRCFVSRHGGWVHWYQNIGETTARTRRGGCSSAWCQRRDWRPACRLYDGVTNHATTQAGSRDNAMERGQIFAAGA